jgi:enoyl-CoA hydratase
MGESFESLAVDVDGHVAQVTLLGPGKGNAMGPAFWAELPVAFQALDADPDVRAIVLTGSGKNFSYGLDLPAMGGTLAPVLAEGALARPRTEFHAKVRAMQHAITAVADSRTPVIASIQGWCIGGGVDLIAAVDVRYASADAKFSVREVKLAVRAEKIGLVNDVFEDAEASLAAAHATAKEIAANPPLVVQGVKDVLDEQRTAQVSASLRYVAAWNSAFLPSKDLTEGITATFAKRPAEFTGE